MMKYTIIFYTKISQATENERLLFVCDSTHLVEQSNRLLQDGFTKVRLPNKSDYFKAEDLNFKYPAIMNKFIDNKLHILNILSQMKQNRK